jgi:hypothetical protein
LLSIASVSNAHHNHNILINITCYYLFFYTAANFQKSVTVTIRKLLQHIIFSYYMYGLYFYFIPTMYM